jgi:hypothetical protein
MLVCGIVSKFVLWGEEGCEVFGEVTLLLLSELLLVEQPRELVVEALDACDEYGDEDGENSFKISPICSSMRVIL